MRTLEKEEEMMRFSGRILALLFVVLVMTSSTAVARTGVGIIAGEPTGFSAKRWLSDETAVDLATGWSLTNGDFYLHCDYLWHRIVQDTRAGASVPLHFGAGGRLLIRDDADSKLGVRFPVGLSFPLQDGRFDIFVEIAPILNLVPDTEFDLSGGVGARYYF